MKHPIDVVIGGILALMIAMGVGRFSYTPILPILQKDVGLSVVNAGYLASSNYIGYLLGAMMAGIIRWKGESLTFFRMILWIAIISIAGMGLTENYYLWVLLRFISGITSALIFVFTSSIVLDVLAGHQRMTWSGLFYSGVGFGIVLTGIVVPILDHYFGWRGTWIGLAAISALFSFTVVKLLKKKDSRTINNHNVKSYSENEQSKKLLPYLVAAYGFEGFGYIISGTFLVAIVEKIPAFHHFTSLSWILVGIAAIPSSYLWMKAVERYGYILALILAYFIQAISIVLPVFFYNSFGAFAGAFMFGVTFMGITTMATSAGRMIQPKKSTKVIGYLTSVYGIGQIIGPMVAGHLVAFTGNYRAALGLAAITLLIGAVLLFVGQRKISYRF